MPKFKCKKCGRTANTEFEECCGPETACREKHPECCGQPMIEVTDD